MRAARIAREITGYVPVLAHCSDSAKAVLTITAVLPVGERLNEVENFFARRFPGALSTSLMDVANLLEAEADPAYGPAIEHLRRAEQAAFARAFDGAREHYTNALSALAEVWTNTPSD